MEFSVIQILLVAVWTFILGIDQFSLTEILYRPIISCTVIGAILGDVKTGLVVGGTYEIAIVGNMPIGGAQPPNPVLGGVMAATFAVGSGLPIDSVIGLAIPFALLGQLFVTLVFTLNSGFMSIADKYAAEGNTKGIVRLNWFGMALIGLAFAIVSVIGLVGGKAAGDALNQFLIDFDWLNRGLNAAGLMMRFVGFAILMKIMMAKDLWGWYLTGFALATIVGAVGGKVAGAALILLAIVGATVALYDYNVNVKLAAAGSNNGGGEEDGI